MKPIDKDGLLAKIPKMTREQFELRLANIETCAAMAFESAKSLNYLECSARDHARQRRMNMMVETMICALEDESDVTIPCFREERDVHVPFPLRVDRKQALIAFDRENRN